MKREKEARVACTLALACTVVTGVLQSEASELDEAREGSWEDPNKEPSIDVTLVLAILSMLVLVEKKDEAGAEAARGGEEDENEDAEVVAADAGDALSLLPASPWP